MQPLSSAITGQVEQVQRRQSLAGREPGTTASSKSLTVTDETARDWLLRQVSPAAADEALCRSLISTLGATAVLRTEGRYPQSGPAYRVVVGCDFALEDPNAIPEIRDKIEASMTPPTAEQAELWMAMLQAATAHRADSDAATALTYALYTAELRQWPADVAKAACMKLARTKPGGGTNWFPPLADLVAECERLAAPRQAMLHGIKNHTPMRPLPLTARGIEEPTPEQKEAVRKMAREAAEKLATSAEERRPIRSDDLPSIAGKPDETGITPAMRALLERQREVR